MRKLAVILALLLASWLGVDASAAPKVQWRETTAEVQGKSLVDPRNSDGVEIYGRNGTITIKTPKPVQVRVFTILGQLISQASLPAGTSELKVNSRGIYMVKVGNITQKVPL